jgi:hypothetical protein
MKAIVRLLLVVALVMTCGSAPAGQTAATARVMREKLVHAQQLLRAIMISDYKLLEQESTALSRVTKTEGWNVLTSPEYLRQSAAFVRSMDDLVEAAKQRDLDAAAVGYTVMTMRCYQCHRYLKGTRIAGR